MEPPSKRKKLVVSMQQRLEALIMMDNGTANKTIAEDYGVGISTVSDWKKNRKHIEDFCGKVVDKNSLVNRSTARMSKNEDLDEALILWFNQQRENGVSITGPIIQEEARTLNEKLGGDPSFTASAGWLTRFKHRHGIRLPLNQLATGEIFTEASQVCSVNFDSDDKIAASQIYSNNGEEPPNRMSPAEALASISDQEELGRIAVSQRYSNDEVEPPNRMLQAEALASIVDQTEPDNTALCSQKTYQRKNPADDDDGVKGGGIITHAQAASKFEELLSYLKQQDDTDPTELLIVNRIRDRTASKRDLELRQTKITEFFIKEENILY